MKVKVAHLTSVHSRHDVRIFVKQCASLVQAGYETYLVVADGKGDACENGINIFDIGASKNRFERMTCAPRRLLARSLRIDAAIYHLHDPELIPIGLKLKKIGKRVIFDAHEDFPKQLLGKPYLNKASRWGLSRAFALYEAFVIRKFDFVIAATPYIREKYQRLGVRSIDVNNFPVLGEFSFQFDDWREKQNFVCYIGGITRIRGILEVIRSLAQVKSDVRLQLVGKFSEPEFEKHANNEPGWERVDELGFLERPSVAQVLHRSVAGLVTFLPSPNHVESQPNKMFEYMSAGIPVIASDFPLWRDIIVGNECGLCVDPLNPKSIAQAIDYLISTPEKAAQMGINGQEAVKRKYNWAIEEQKLLRVYKEFA